jgi:integrase
MSRRSGQTGRVERKGNKYYARFWIDVPGEAKRKYKCVFLCPAFGNGYLNQSERKRRCKEIIAESGANSEAICREARGAHLGTTFQEQSEAFLAAVQVRKRRPVKARTVSSWKSALKWINEHIGAVPLADVKNATVKDLVSKMAGEKKGEQPRFGAKSITNFVYVAKAVVASALDKDGEQLYLVKWNADFLDVPIVRDQRKPTFSADEVTDIINRAEDQDKLLYALLAGSGLRIGEAIALRVEDVVGATIQVRATMWNNQLGSPKTDAGLRDVDLHSSLARALAEHIGKRKAGYVFENEAKGALHQSNLLRRSLHPILHGLGREKAGFHAFRRFRVTHLRKSRVPEDLIRFWIGHADKTITDEYSQIREDVEFRRFTAEQCGLGFTLPELPVARIARNEVTEECAVSA